MIAEVSKSTRDSKKWMVVLKEDGQKIKTIHFGSSKHDDFTMHKDKKRMIRYLTRHGGLPPTYEISSSEFWANPKTAGFWSRWLLWNKPSLKGSARDITKKYGVKVKFI